MKTDAKLKRDVEAELAWDPAVHADAIGVAAKNGIVTVTGHLDTFGEKLAVERAVRRVKGVQAMAVELDVKLAPQHRRSDTEIALAAEQALKWHSAVPPEKVLLSVDNGWVTLRGQVDWEFQREAAAKAIRPLTGVVGLSNMIELAPRSAVKTEMVEQITRAMKRHAADEADQLQIDVDASTVTLRGTVHSWAERSAVAGACWSAAGVGRVVNELRVAA